MRTGSPPKSTNTSRTGGLWGVRDFREVVVPDGKWFTLAIRIEGKRVVTGLEIEDGI